MQGEDEKILSMAYSRSAIANWKHRKTHFLAFFIPSEMANLRLQNERKFLILRTKTAAKIYGCFCE